jgi:hypothetical protein
MLSLRIPLASCLAATLVATLAAHGQAPDAAGPAVSLFNGKNLAGWVVAPDDGGHWKVVDGAIDYDALSQSKTDKNLWTEKSYTDFVLELDWRFKEAPYLNKFIPYILPDGTHAKDIKGQEMKLALPDADSGIGIRGDIRYQVNLWCWPIGSGEMYGIRTDPATSPELRAAVTPKHQADKPVGEWNHMQITVKGQTVRTVLNGVPVVEATIPDLPPTGRIGFQHHGAANEAGEWTGPPSLIQFKNITIRELK